MRANIKNFLKSFIDENKISIKLPLRMSVRSIPKTTKSIPRGMLRTKKSPKKDRIRKAKWRNRI